MPVAKIVRGFVRDSLAVRGKDITAEHVVPYTNFANVQTLKKWVGGARKKAGTPTDDRFWKDTGRQRTKREVNNYLKCFRALLAIGERTRDPTTRLPVLEQAP